MSVTLEDDRLDETFAAQRRAHVAVCHETLAKVCDASNCGAA